MELHSLCQISNIILQICNKRNAGNFQKDYKEVAAGLTSVQELQHNDLGLKQTMTEIQGTMIHVLHVVKHQTLR